MWITVFSLFGVVLIARPEFLFGGASHVSGANSVVDRVLAVSNSSEQATPAERLGAVGYGVVIIALNHVFPLRSNFLMLSCIGSL